MRYEDLDVAYYLGAFYELHLTLSYLARDAGYAHNVGSLDEFVFNPRRGYQRIGLYRDNTLKIRCSHLERSTLSHWLLRDLVSLFLDSVPPRPFTPAEEVAFDLGREDWYQENQDFLFWPLDVGGLYPLASEASLNYNSPEEEDHEDCGDSEEGPWS